MGRFHLVALIAFLVYALFCGVRGVNALGIEDDEFSVPGQVYLVNSTGLANARQRFDRLVVMFFAPWCSACQRLKPKYVDAAASMSDDANVRYLSIDATQELGLTLQFDIHYYPTVVRIEKDGSCWEWQREEYSLAQLGGTSFDSSSSNGKWNSFVAPYSRLGLWKYRLGAFVQFGVNFYQKQTEGKGPFVTAAWATGILMALAAALLLFMYCSIWIFSPKQVLPQDPHED